LGRKQKNRKRIAKRDKYYDGKKKSENVGGKKEETVDINMGIKLKENGRNLRASDTGEKVDLNSDGQNESMLSNIRKASLIMVCGRASTLYLYVWYYDVINYGMSKHHYFKRTCSSM
jgi:hypothetical protein